MVAAHWHDFGIDFSLRTSLQISSMKLRRMEHLLKHMMKIWSRWQGEPEAFILLTILHILLYVGGKRSNSTDGSLNFGIPPFLKFLFPLPSFLFHSLLRYFTVPPTHTQPPPALIRPTNLLWFKQILKELFYQFNCRFLSKFNF